MNDVAVLLARLGYDPTAIEPLVGGMWSKAWGFVHDGRRLVARINPDDADLRKDDYAQRWTTVAAPVPRFHRIERVDDRWVAITDRVRGRPLEQVTAAEWPATLPAVVDLLESLRRAPLDGTFGWGPWSADGRAPASTWWEWLLGVGSHRWVIDHSDWRDRAEPALERFFDDRHARLVDLTSSLGAIDLPRCLVHADLLHGNVLVDDHQISGVFDWQCSVFGDHLYDLAWFEFFAPWHPGHDILALDASMAQRWDDIGYRPAEAGARRDVALTHNALDHIVYCLQHGTTEDAVAMADRLAVLVP